MLNHKYISGEYASKNPDWDTQDSPWKADIIFNMMLKNDIKPRTLVEIGCGAGDVLVNLSKKMNCIFKGYDISPNLLKFWQRNESANITFELGDFEKINQDRYDVILVLDVVEHVSDPFYFIESLKTSADYYIFHIPLDLNSISVLREKPLLHVREKVGHVHYFTKNIALAMLKESGFMIVDHTYTDAFFHASRISIKSLIAAVPRYLLGIINKDFSARLLGGQTLLVLARNEANNSGS